MNHPLALICSHEREKTVKSFTYLIYSHESLSINKKKPTTTAVWNMASISLFECLCRVILAYVKFFINLLIDIFWFRFTRAIVFSIFPAPKKSINEEIVLITGSGGVLGRALAVEFSKYGAFLCLWDSDEIENQKTYELLYSQYNHRHMVAMNVDITFVV